MSTRKITIHYRVDGDTIEEFLHEIASENMFDDGDSDTTFLEGNEVTELTEDEEDYLFDNLTEDDVVAIVPNEDGDFTLVYEIDVDTDDDDDDKD